MSTTRMATSLLHVLSDVLPTLILNAKSCSRLPLKLLIIDSIARLLHYDKEGGKTSMATLSEHSHNLSTIATHLHALTVTHQLAVIVLNHMTDMCTMQRHHHTALVMAVAMVPHVEDSHNCKRLHAASVTVRPPCQNKLWLVCSFRHLGGQQY